jgi:5-hydroxyisourate hydrolase
VTTLSTHVLDAVTGRPAVGVSVALEIRIGDAWQRLVDAETDSDGRYRDFPALAEPGTARLLFDTGAYLGPDAFYPEVVLTFRVTGADDHLHVPLLLSPYAYSTYRGS